ncbi:MULTISPECIES: fimbrial protein [Pseudomonas]|uniref:fimbrial protein n=1 Tax=Pseudomonas TaxID=286 RepID=UPI001AEA5C06|nr:MULTISPECIES: fimbrial protein [unclassified Pseudomonas]MBP1128000.1 hypothetical protein [Pseudomonas sp. PvP025]MDQ0396938.1 hypothetical protein [Pseudomonas sp. PvP006]
MKQMHAVIVLLALIGVTTTAQAVDCRVNGGPWVNGNPDLQVPVTVTLSSDRTRILMEGARLECRFTPGGPAWGQDYWRSGSVAGTPWSPGPKFAGEGTGLRINASFYNTPVPSGIHLATMPNNGVGYPINITPYIVMHNSPTNPINVRIGDNLGLLRLTATNNYDSQVALLTVTYSAANNFEVSPSTCTINNNNAITVDFGTVHQRSIGTDPLTSTTVSNRRLTYSCPDGGINSPITITYRGTRSSFDSRLLLMSNPDVGTAMVHAGTPVPVNGLFHTRITNSVGGDDVTFSLVRRDGSIPTAGAISGSGVLVMGVP